MARPLLTPPIADLNSDSYTIAYIDTGNILVNYTGLTPQAQAAFQYAADIWGSLIDSPVSREIDATFTNLGSGIR